MEISVRFPFPGFTCRPTCSFLCCNVAGKWKLMYVFRFQDEHVQLLMCVAM